MKKKESKGRKEQNELMDLRNYPYNTWILNLLYSSKSYFKCQQKTALYFSGHKSYGWFKSLERKAEEGEEGDIAKEEQNF